MSKYFITIEDVALLSGFDGNIDNDSINPFIFMAQRNDIERILGDNLYTKIADDFEADSLDFIELITAVEDTFKIEIPDEDAENLQTVQDALDYIESKI